jgi:hypothetical protein
LLNTRSECEDPIRYPSNAKVSLSVLTNLTGQAEQFNNTINWAHVESMLSHYTVGTSKEVARVYLLSIHTLSNSLMEEAL